MPSLVLIADDDPVQRRLLKASAERAGYVTVLVDNGRAAFEHLTDSSTAIDAVVLDLMMPEMDGLEVLERLGQLGSTIPVVVQTGQGGLDTVVKAMRAGAFDFVVKPVSPERLALALKNALKATRVHAAPKPQRRHFGFKDIVAASSEMERVISLAKRAAASEIPVVLEGESGVGKEMIAQAIQVESSRRGKPFVTVNCGAIPENLVESVLFGHEKGAFTGATERHAGKFVEADGGTLFLDEIGDLPLEAQVKLLRAVQSGEIETVGARAPKKVDIRLISATNKDLIAEVKQGRFREDLYYRLNVFPIQVPALRKRKEDIPQLARHFAERHASTIGGNRIQGFTPDAMALLTAHVWPGNIRELENAVYRAVILCDGPVLSADLFPQIAAQIPGYSLEQQADLDVARGQSELLHGAGDVLHQANAPLDPFAVIESHDGVGVNTLHENHAQFVPVVNSDGDVRAIVDVEEDLIRFALAMYDGQMSEVARRLGIGRSTLYRKLKDYDIYPDELKRQTA